MSRLKHIYNYFYQENLMSEKGLTTINLKKINRSKVYQYIYKTHQTSKMQIVHFSLYFKERETWKLWNNSESIFEKDQGITIK